LLNSLRKEMFRYTRIHLLLVNWYRHSMEPCALMCPFKQSNLSVWSPMSWQPTHAHLCGRLSVFPKLFASPSQSHHCSPPWWSHQVTGICISQGLIWQKVFNLTPFALLLLTNCIAVIMRYVNANHLEYQWIGKPNKKLKQNAPRTRFLMKQNAPQARFLMKK